MHFVLMFVHKLSLYKIAEFSKSAAEVCAAAPPPTIGVGVTDRMIRLLAATVGSVGVIIFIARRLVRRANARAAHAPLAFSSVTTHRAYGYKLSVSLPLRYHEHPDKTFPVLFALDSEPYLFGLLTICARTNHFFARSYYFPDIIVVGVVADIEAEHSRDGRVDAWALWQGMRPTRARDYLPTAAESPWGGPGAPSLLHVSGHADEFAATLAASLVPLIDRLYRTDPQRRALIGKSFGGSGVASAMIHAQCGALFTQFIMCSPSLAWDDGAFFRIEAERRATMVAQADPRMALLPYGDVYCCAGSEEGTESVLRLKDCLDSRPGPHGECQVEIVQGETHGSVSYPFVHRALEWLKTKWPEST